MISSPNSKINTAETDYLASFVHNRLDILMVLKEDRQSSSAFWEERDSSNPDKVIGDPYVAIDFSYHYFLGLEEDGHLKSWSRYHGNKRIYPKTTFISIATGINHSAALTDNGKLVVWGGIDKFRQIDVPGGFYTAIVAGDYHNTVLRDDGGLKAVGDNYWGQTDAPDGTYTAVAAGSNHNVALRDDGTLAAWGFNYYGQTDVDDGTYTAVAAGGEYSLALRDDDELVIFGSCQHEIKDTYLLKNRPFIASGSHQTFVIKPDGGFLVFDNRRPNSDLGQSPDRLSMLEYEAVSP